MCKIKTQGVLSARVLMNLEWRRESGPEIKCSRCPADQMMEAGVLLITYISKRRLPEQSHFPHEWHVQDQRWTNTTTTTTQREHKWQTHNCDSDTTPAKPFTTGKKRKKDENETHSLNQNADKEEKLLVFSYLFVPLLCLGMKGEKKRERDNKELVTGNVDCEVLES